MSYKKELGLLIKKLRKDHKYTQDKLAEVCDVPMRTIQDIEGGLRQPRLETLFKLSKGLGIEYKSLTDPVFETWKKNGNKA